MNKFFPSILYKPKQRNHEETCATNWKGKRRRSHHQAFFHQQQRRLALAGTRNYPRNKTWVVSVGWMNQTFTNGKWLEITKHPLKTGCLGLQVAMASSMLKVSANVEARKCTCNHQQRDLHTNVLPEGNFMVRRSWNMRCIRIYICQCNICAYNSIIYHRF